MTSTSTYNPFASTVGTKHGFQSEHIDPNASQMSLYDFRQSGRQFHWKGSNNAHEVFSEHEPWPLHHVAKLSDLQKAQAIVWASKVTADDHGFSDTVADKIVKYNTREQKMKAQAEVENLRKLDHNHIVVFLGSYTKVDHLGILMFPVAAMDLGNFLESSDVHRWIECMCPWFSCLTQALNYLHTRKNPFKHRDIKPANILIDRTGTVFLTDFGISKEYPNEQASVTAGDGRFTVEYASPSMVKQTNQGLESDVFCLGCVFLEMATVMFGKRIGDMHECISGRTGMSGKIEYHRDFQHLVTWVEELRECVRDDSPPYLVYLAGQGLAMIMRMITECAVTPSTNLGLVEVSRVMSGLSSKPCKSCTEMTNGEPILENEQIRVQRLLGERSTVQQPFLPDHQASEISHDTAQELQSAQKSAFQDCPDIGNPTTSLDNHLQCNVVEGTAGASSVIPSIRLQRTATDLPEAHDLNGPLEGSTSETSPKKRTFEIELDPASLGNQDDGIARDTTERASDQIRVNKKPSFSIDDGVPSHSVKPRRTNSKIRMVETRKNELHSQFYEDVSDVPGDFILTYSRERNKWRAKPKTEFDQLQLRRGTLYKMPRGIRSNYRVPSGPGTTGALFWPWKELSLSKNMKRMFGRSMPTMFIEGRKTTEDLRADLKL